MDAIKARDINKRYRKGGFALEDVSFTLPSGCVMGLVGRNGAGKTTLIRILLDMIPTDSGSYALLGEEDTVKAKDDVGAVFDEILLSDSWKPGKIGRWAKDVWSHWDEEFYMSLLEKYDVPKDLRIQKLSKGQKMKLQLAMALAHRPKLLVLDEATSGLDPVVRDEVLDMINDFTRDEDHSVLISSHITGDLEKVCDYIGFMKEGKLVFNEEKDRILEEYGVLQCTREVMEGLDPRAVVYKKESSYGVEAVVKRSMVPPSMEILPATLEEIFVSMMKEE